MRCMRKQSLTHLMCSKALDAEFGLVITGANAPLLIIDDHTNCCI